VYLPIRTQPDCATAWLEAVKGVDALKSSHEAHNVLIDVADPVANTTLANPIVRQVNEFLGLREKSVDTIANTIFPAALYRLHGHPKFVEVFHKYVLPKVAKNSKWSGYYFERMTKAPDQLSTQVERLRKKSNKALHKFELSLFDPERDVDNSPYGGQCLSFLSFHVVPGTPRTLLLTAQYRNHYYVEKLLGNLIGLGRLMSFVAAETNSKVGSLTVLSTHAEIDLPKPCTRQDITDLMERCSQPLARVNSAA
jgi:hypothetical protein